MSDHWGTTTGGAVIAGVGGVAALLAIPNVNSGVLVGGTVGVVAGFGLVLWSQLRRKEPSAPTLPIVARARCKEIPAETSASPQSSSRSIAAAVFGERVVSEGIIQTGPGNTRITLIISGSPIPQTHVDELIRLYQARYHRGVIDLTITSSDRSVEARAGGEGRRVPSISLPPGAVSPTLLGDRARREIVVQETPSRHIRVELDIIGPPLIEQDVNTVCLIFKQRYRAPSIEMIVTTDHQTNTYHV